MNNRISTGLLGLLSIFFLAFAIFASNVVFRNQIKTITRAKEDVTVSTQNSLLFAWPLSVKADNQTSTDITIFARSQNGKPVANKEVTVTTTLGQVSPPTNVTDKDGKTAFKLVSGSTGMADLEATIDNVKINQKVSVKFE